MCDKGCSSNLDNQATSAYRYEMESIIECRDMASSANNDLAGDDLSQHPWRLLRRLLRRALKWMLFATVMVFVVALSPIVIDGSLRVIAALRHLKPNPPADFSAFLPYSAIALQVVLLWGAIRGARAASPEKLGAGLANRPLRA
jgi:hypothetical protein